MDLNNIYIDLSPFNNYLLQNNNKKLMMNEKVKLHLYDCVFKVVMHLRSCSCFHLQWELKDLVFSNPLKSTMIRASPPYIIVEYT